MEGILLHVLYRGEKANDFASEMERSGLRAAATASARRPSRQMPTIHVQTIGL